MPLNHINLLNFLDFINTFIAFLAPCLLFLKYRLPSSLLHKLTKTIIEINDNYNGN